MWHVVGHRTGCYRCPPIRRAGPVVLALFGVLPGPSGVAAQPPPAPDPAEEPPLEQDTLDRAPSPAPEPEPDADERRRFPDRLGPFDITADSGDRLRIAFSTQIRVTSGGGDRRSPRTVAEIRRIRPVLLGAMFDERLRFTLQLNTSAASLELIDLWVEWWFPSRLRLRVGQTKVPFTRYRLQSFSTLTLTDWAINTRMFGGERQIGAVLRNRPESPVRLEVGVFSGQNARNTHGVGTVDAYGELLTNPSNLRDPGALQDIHPELFLQVTHASPDLDQRSGSDATGGPLRALVSFSSAWDIRPEAAQDFMLRFAVDALLKWNGWGLTGVGYVGFFEPTESGGLAEGAAAGLVELDRRFAKWLSLTLRYVVEERFDALNGDAQDRAERLMVDDPDDPDNPRRTDLAGRIARRHELGLGANAYVIGQDLKVQLEAAWRRDVETTAFGGALRDSYRIRGQLQLRL